MHFSFYFLNITNVIIYQWFDHDTTKNAHDEIWVYLRWTLYWLKVKSMIFFANRMTRYHIYFNTKYSTNCIRIYHHLPMSKSKGYLHDKRPVAWNRVILSDISIWVLKICWCTSTLLKTDNVLYACKYNCTSGQTCMWVVRSVLSVGHDFLFSHIFAEYFHISNFYLDKSVS